MAATITLLTEDAAVELAAEVGGDDLWIAASEMERATGWRLTPEGLCRGPVCIPMPRGREAELCRADGAVNLTGLARQRGQALVRDGGGTVWALDAGTAARSDTRVSLAAPDFELPDLSGRRYALHAFRGKKVLLASWASW